MVSDMVRHETIHLSNPDINYVRLENCKYCKIARMRNYDQHRRNGSIPERINVVNYYTPAYYNYTYYNSVYYNPIFEEYQDVELNTTLKRLNSSTSLQISNKIDFCPICQDKIDTNIIIRKLDCGHKFHQECVDKWLETNAKCPVCRYQI